MNVLDLSLLPPPDALLPLDFERLLAERKAELLADLPEAQRPAVAETLSLESEPLNIALQNAAYRELLLRHTINQSILAAFLATATGADLDHHGAAWGLQRHVLQAAQPNARPPVPQQLEADADFRRRIQLAPYKLSNAGTADAYKAHVLDAHGDVKDAASTRPIPGTVRIHVLAHSNDGQASATVLNAVHAHLNQEHIRPLNDRIEVVAATRKAFQLRYQIDYASRPDTPAIQAEIQRRLNDLWPSKHRLGQTVALVHLYGALDVSGVNQARILSPSADIVCQAHEYPWLSASIEVLP